MSDCQIHWATLDALDPHHDELLDVVERGRRDRYQREEDRRRFTLGAVLLRLVAGPEQQIDRACERCGEPHGRPRLPGDDRHVSVSHSGQVAAVAVTDAGAVGVDVEAMRAFDHSPLLQDVLAPGERAPGLEAFWAYWTRKESVLKATGVGLAVPMREVAVTAPGEPPRLLSYRGGRLSARMADVVFAPGHVGAATVLTAHHVQFHAHDAREWLSGYRRGKR